MNNEKLAGGFDDNRQEKILHFEILKFSTE